MKQSPKPTNLYSCTQAELYAVARLGYDSCEEKLADFALLKASYTPQYLAAQRQLILDAELIPDMQAREDIAERLRIDLKEKADGGLINWQSLKIYILAAFPKKHQKTALEAAGSKLYDKAGKYNWEVVKNLLEAGSIFIDKEKVTLEANNNMPPTFQAAFDTHKDEYIALYQQYKDAEQDIDIATAEKINANNTVFANLMVMFKDGQHIFRFDRAVQERFIFEKVLELVTGTGGGTPQTPKLTATSDQSILDDVEMGFNAPVGEIINANLGDNNTLNIPMDGTTIFNNHSYAAPGTYPIEFTGIEKVREVHMNNSRLTDFNIHPSMTDINELILQGNLFTTPVADKIVIDVNNLGTSGPGKVLNLAGSQPLSAAGLAAKAELESRGWIVIVS